MVEGAGYTTQKHQWWRFKVRTYIYKSDRIQRESVCVKDGVKKGYMYT